MPRDDATEMVRRQIEANICYFDRHKELIDERIDQLKREWSLESALQFWTGIGGTLGMVMNAVTRKRFWRIVNLASVGMMLEFAASGRGPAYQALRRMGFRTTKEIERERCALESLLTGRRKAHEPAITGSEG